MNENRRQILNMLAEGKITAAEAERLLAALEAGPNASFSGSSQPGAAETPRSRAKYLRVLVESKEGANGDQQGHHGPTSVNIRVPMQLLRAGVRLASLIPAQAHQHFDQALSSHGVPLTLSQIKPENLEELIDHLDDLTVDVASKDSHNDVKVRVFSE